MSDLTVLKEIGAIQETYNKLVKTKAFTKKALCELVVPFRDKYNLSDLEALRIVRNQMPIAEMAEILQAKSSARAEKNLAETSDRGPAYVAVFMNEEPFCYGEDTAICLAVDRKALEKVNVDDVNAFLEQFGFCDESTHVWKFEEISAKEADENFHGNGASCGSFFFPTRDQWSVIDFEHLPEGGLIYGQP